VPKIIYTIQADSKQGTRALREFSKAQTEVAKGANRTESAFVKSRNAAQQFATKLKSVQFPRQLLTQFDKLRLSIRANGDEIKKLGTKMATLGQKTRTLGAELTIASLAVGALGGGSIKAAASFESQFTKIRTLVLGVDADTRQLEEDVKNLAVASGIGPAELAEAMFVVTSAGARGADIMDILSRSAKAAALGLGETETIARAVTGAMKAFESQGLDASQAVDTLVATVREGNLEAADLAGSLGRVGAIASQAGLSFQDVGGFIASFTRAGVGAEEAVTALRGVVTGLLKPANEAEVAFKAFGTTADAVRQSIKEKGLATTMVELIETTGGSATAMAQLIPNVRALAGVLATAGAQGTSFIEIEKNIKNATGILNEGFQALQEDTTQQFKIIVAELQVMAIEFGSNFLPIIKDSVIPVIKSLVGWLASVVEAFGNAPPFVQKLVLALGVIITILGPLMILIGTLISAVGTITTAFGAAAASGGIFATVLTGIAAAAGPVAAVIGVALAGVAIGRLIGSLEISGRSIDEWILKWRGLPDVRANNEELAESTSRLADILKNEYNTVIDQGRLSVEEWNIQVLQAFKAAKKKKEELARLAEAQELANKVTKTGAENNEELAKQTEAAAKAEAALLKKFNETANPAKKLAGEIKILLDNKKSASDIAKVYGKRLLKLEDTFDELDPTIQAVVKDLLELAKKNRAAELATKKNERAQKKFREEMKALDDELKRFPNIAKNVITDFGRLAAKGAKLEDMSRILGGRLGELEDHLEELPPDVRATVQAYIKLIKKHDEAAKAARDQTEAVTETQEALEDLRNEIPDVISEFDNFKDAGATDAEILELMGDKLMKVIELAKALGIELPEEVARMGEFAKATKDSADQAEQWEQVWVEAMGKVVADFSQGISDMIFEGASFGDTMIGIFKDLGKTAVRILTQELFSPVLQLMQGVGKVISQGISGLLSGEGFSGFNFGGLIPKGLGGEGGFFGTTAAFGATGGMIGAGIGGAVGGETGAALGGAIGGGGLALLAKIPALSFLGGPIGLAIGGLAVAIPLLMKLLAKSPGEKAFKELGRDFAGIGGDQGQFNEFVQSFVGISEKQLESVRKETTTLFALFRGLAPSAGKGEQEALIAALSDFGVSGAIGQGAIAKDPSLKFRTDQKGNFFFDLSEAAREAIEEGNVDKLREQLTAILGASDFSKMVPNFEELIAQLTNMADISAKVAIAWEEIDAATQEALSSFIETGVMTDELRVKLEAVDPAAAGLAESLSEDIQAAAALKNEFDSLSSSLGDLLPHVDSNITKFLQTGELTDELRQKITELGGDVEKFEAFQKIVRDAEAAGLTLAEFIADNEAAQQVVTDLQTELGGLSKTLADQIAIMTTRFEEAINKLILALGNLKGAAADTAAAVGSSTGAMEDDANDATDAINNIPDSDGSGSGSRGGGIMDEEFALGGIVGRTGFAKVHAGELVLTPSQTNQFAAATAMFESITARFSQATANIRPKGDTGGEGSSGRSDASSTSSGGVTVNVEGSTVNISGGAEGIDRTALAIKIKEIMDRNSEQTAEVIARRVSRILSTIEVE